MSKIYLVTFDGYNDSYGCSIDVLGVYDSKDKANAAIDYAINTPVKQSKENDIWSCKPTIPCKDAFTVTELELNSTPEALISDSWGYLTGQANLGGYVE